MALSIKTDEADHLARQLAALTGESLTDAVTVALRERISRLRPPEDLFLERIRRLQDEIAAHPVVDNRTADEIIGYDENGLPS
jgi:antitoxin VapB